MESILFRLNNLDEENTAFKAAQKKMRKAQAKARRIKDPDFQKGELLMKKPGASQGIGDLTRIPGVGSKEEEAVDRIINERTQYPMSRETATQQYNEETASKGIEMAKKRRQATAVRPSSKKIDSTQDLAKTKAALGLASQAGGGVGDIASGAMAGAPLGPWGMAAGAALGAAKGQAKRKREIQKLQAEAILGEAAAAEKASKGEREALQNIIETLRSALTF